MAFLETKGLTLSIGERILCRNLDLVIEENQSWGLLGRNGAGKTSLLHSLLGIRPIQAGAVFIEGEDLQAIPRQRLATRIGILFQEGMDSLPATVMETVMLGRHPHVQSVLKDDPADVQIALGALQDLQLTEFAERSVDTLSGGEKQRLALAMLIAQAPRLYLLDEPSNHLDVAYQVKLLELLRDKLAGQAASLLMATHDINLAARYCDHIVLLMGDGSFIRGRRDEVLSEDNLSVAYDCPIRSVASGTRRLYFPA